MSSNTTGGDLPERKPRLTFDSEALAGRVCGVTGGARRIGEATAKRLAQLGAAVIVLDRQEDNLRRVEADLREIGGEVLCLHGDVTDLPFLTDAFAQIERRWGRLDGWVNNVTSGLEQPVEEQPEEEFIAVWNVNVLTAWRSIKMGLPLLRRAGGGAVVNLSSVQAHRSPAGKAAYVSAKAGMEGLTRACAIEFAEDRIRVNAVVPGSIPMPEEVTKWAAAAAAAIGPDPTPEMRAQAEQEARQRRFQPWPRTGAPDDIANAVAFLLSDAAEFITGVTLPVDGGYLIDAGRRRRRPRPPVAAS